MTDSHDTEHLRRLYARSTDPSAFRTSAYENEKYRRTIAALGERRFGSGFEPGCSIGVLTRMLAARRENLLVADIIEEPLHTARAFCDAWQPTSERSARRAELLPLLLFGWPRQRYNLWLREAYSARGLSRVGADASVERPAQRPSNS